jgi:hypothetical protein
MVYFSSVYPKFIYLGVMFNDIVSPDVCKHYPLCPKRLFENLRTINDQNFSLTSEELKYLTMKQ